MHKTFFGGIHTMLMSHRKYMTENKPIEVMKELKTYCVPVTQSIGGEPLLEVKVSDKVKKGTLLAKKSGDVSANTFSPVSGKVVEIKNMRCISGAMGTHIIIENDFTDSEEKLPELENPTSDQIIQRVSDAGIVGMGGAAFPTAIKLDIPEGKHCDTLLINASECEPYITCDYRILIELTDDFYKGVMLIKKAVNAEKVIIGIEDNKMPAIEKLQSYQDITVIPLKSKYPQGAEKQLIYALTKRKVQPGGLPIDCGVIVHNVHTALSVQRAVFLGIPCCERVITVSGEAIKEQKNLWVKTGTSIEDIAEFCGGTSENVVKILNGGPMMGYAQPNMQTCITKATSCILFLSDSELDLMEASTCIRCAKCANICPMNLMPMFIDNHTINGDLEGAKKYNATSCIECGCCSFICPAKRPLVQSIRLSKKLIKERNI